jgi:hypothetical protein
MQGWPEYVSATQINARSVEVRTLLHCLTEFNDMADIWVWTHARTDLTLRNDPRYIPPMTPVHPP